MWFSFLRKGQKFKLLGEVDTLLLHIEKETVEVVLAFDQYASFLSTNWQETSGQIMHRLANLLGTLW